MNTSHDRYGLSTDAVITRVKAELGGGTHAPWAADPDPATA